MMFKDIFQSFLLPAIVLGLTGGVFGVLISLASIAFYVEEDVRVEDVTNLLPGYNCGACGHPGCVGLANAIVFDGANPIQCKPGKQDMRDKIKAYLEESDRKLKESNA